MTKRDLAKAIADELGITHVQAQAVVRRVFDGIVATLVAERRIELRNFGVFEVKERKPRRARNPRTGERVAVPPRAVVTFRPGREMADQVARLVGAPDKGPAAAAPAEVPE